MITEEKMFKATLYAVATVTAMLSINAMASVITFNGLGGTAMPGSTTPGYDFPYGPLTYFAPGQAAQVDGYTFDDLYPVNTMIVPPRPSDINGNSDFAWNGTDYFVAFTPRITSTSATPFTLNSIDLAGWMGNLDVIVLGTRTNYSVVSTRIAHYADNKAVANDFITYTLDGFSDLRAVSFYPYSGPVAIDNLNVSSRSIDVPEPASWAMLGLGLVVLGAARRRHTMS